MSVVGENSRSGSRARKAKLLSSMCQPTMHLICATATHAVRVILRYGYFGGDDSLILTVYVSFYADCPGS